MNAPAYPYSRVEAKRAFKADEAAGYCGMSKSKWLQLVNDKEAPKPVHITENMPRWYLEDLDAWLDGKKTVKPVKSGGPKRYAR